MLIAYRLQRAAKLRSCFGSSFSNLLSLLGSGLVLLLGVSALNVYALDSGNEQSSKEQADGFLDNWIVAVIDGEPITRYQLQQHAVERNVSLNALAAEGAAGVNELLREMIFGLLLEKEATRLGIGLEEKAVDHYIAQVQKQNKVSHAEFTKELGRRGLSFEQYRSQVRQEILRSRVLNRAVKSKVTVIDEDIERYLNKGVGLPPSGSSHLEQVCVPGAEISDTQFKDLRAQFLKGTPLSTISPQYYSDLGYVNTQDLRAEIRDAIAELNNGELSASFSLGNKRCLVRMLHRVDNPKNDPLIRQQVSETLAKSRYQELAKEYFEKEIVTRYDVEFKTDALNELLRIARAARANVKEVSQ